MRWSFEECSLRYPSGRRAVKIRPDRPQDAIHINGFTGLEQFEKPILRRVFIVVDKGDVIPRSVQHRSVPGTCDVLLWFYNLCHGMPAERRKLGHSASG